MWGESINNYKRDTTESRGKGYPLADFLRGGGVSLIKSSFQKILLKEGMKLNA